MKKKCLVVSGMFVPVNEPMTLIPYKHLRLLDYEYDVMNLIGDTDSGLEEQLKYDKFYKKFNIIDVGNYNDILFSIRNINLIKCLYNMNKYVNDSIRKFNEHNYEMLYTSSFPAYCHRVGKKLKQNRQDFLWIANFTDPINNSPYKFDSETYKNYSLLEKIAFKAYIYFFVNNNDEIIAFENADILIFICEEQRDFMIKQYLSSNSKYDKEYLENKSIIVPLCYIEEFSEYNIDPITQEDNIIKLSHFGRIYGLRKLTNFILAVREIIDQCPEFANKFKIIQYGEFKKQDMNLIRDLHLNDYFEINDKIPYKECLKKMSSSDVVLIFDTILDDEKLQPYLPSKILEYSILQKNVFAIANSNSPTYRLFQESNALCAKYEVDDIKNKLIKILNGYESKINYIHDNPSAIIELSKKLNDIV